MPRTPEDFYLHRLLATAREQLRRRGDLAPVLLVETAAEQLVVGLDELPGQHLERLRLFFAVGFQLANRQPQRIVAVLDAFMKRGGSWPLARSLADDPEAQDCLVLAAMDSDGRSRVLVQSYKRRPSLDGLTLDFDAVEDFGDEAEAFLLEAFFSGVTAHRWFGR